MIKYITLTLMLTICTLTCPLRAETTAEKIQIVSEDIMRMAHEMHRKASMVIEGKIEGITLTTEQKQELLSDYDTLKASMASSYNELP